MFGNSKKNIMYEKTGIIKRGIPVVLGHDMPLQIAIREAKNKKSHYSIIRPNNTKNYTFDELNFKTVRKVLKIIGQRFPVTEEAISRGLGTSMMWRGRLEAINQELLDKIEVKWKLPKLPHKVFHEWKTNFGAVVYIYIYICLFFRIEFSRK